MVRYGSKRMIVPHPSITGMAAGFTLIDDLNKASVLTGGRTTAGTVIDNAAKGRYSDALGVLSVNAQNLIKTQAGRQSLFTAVGIAALGSWARRALPATKIGGTKLYFRI